MFTYLLESERLFLRPLEASDATRLAVEANDETISAMTLAIPYPYTEADAVAFIEMARSRLEAGELYVFAVVPKAIGTLAGCVGLMPARDHRRAEIGYWIGRAHRNQGYTSEAVRRMIRFGFEALDLNRIYAGHFGPNAASGRVMRKAGMCYEGTLRQHYVRKGNIYDAIMYGIVRGDWEEAHPHF